MTTLDAFHHNEQATTIGRDLHEIASRLSAIEDEVFYRNGMPVLALAEELFVKTIIDFLKLSEALAHYNSSLHRRIVS